MDQSFKAVNLDKRELVCPWCMNEGAGLIEWTIGRHSGVLSMLTSKINHTHTDDEPSRSYTIAAGSPDNPVIIAEVSHKSIFDDEPPVASPLSSIIGRWAGDRVCLAGEDDDASLWEEFPSYTNITKELARQWNTFIHNREAQLEFRHCGCESPLADSLPLVTNPKRRFRVTYVVNEDLQLDFWARDSEHAHELAAEAEQEA